MKSVEENRYQVPGLDRALSVIELLNNHPDGLRVNDIAERLGFPINSVYRIMNTLERRAYARKNPDGSGYVLSEKFLSLATPAAGDPGFLENALDLFSFVRMLLLSECNRWQMSRSVSSTRTERVRHSFPSLVCISRISTDNGQSSRISTKH